MLFRDRTLVHELAVYDQCGRLSDAQLDCPVDIVQHVIPFQFEFCGPQPVPDTFRSCGAMRAVGGAE